jgi:large subunit ribosomal protein L9
MKVILTQDVEKLGASHEVVDVNEGYARNYLVPRSLAVVATKSALSNIDAMKRTEARRQTRLRGEAETVATALQAKPLVIDAKVGEAGRLFGSVGAADIASRIKEVFEVTIDRHQVQLEDTIRSAGEYTVPVKLHGDVSAQVKVQVGVGA